MCSFEYSHLVFDVHVSPNCQQALHCGSVAIESIHHARSLAILIERDSRNYCVRQNLKDNHADT